MEYFLLIVLWVINFGISWWDAYVAGKMWIPTKHAFANGEGIWPRAMTWSAAVMSASGFSWCFLILLGFVGYLLHWINQQALLSALSLGYLILIPGILISGLMIMVDSWVQAYKSRRLADMGVAAWNTYAQIHNTYSAVEGIPQAFNTLTSFMGSSSKSSSKDDDDNNSAGGLIAIGVIVAMSIVGGIILTASIIKATAGSESLPDYFRDGA